MTTILEDIERLGTIALRIKAERDKFASALTDVLDALEHARIALDGCSDIDNNGGPNWAMRLLQLADKYEDIEL